MSNFEDTLARMRSLCTYGPDLNESKNTTNATLEFHKKGADGVNYGIIRECNKYYIKSAPNGKEKIAEAYDYLGGFRNRRDYEYTSYTNAKKHFDLKMSSICEACDSRVNQNTEDFAPKTVLMTEGTKKMQAELARQRQIMYNASMIMCESNEISASRKNDVVKYDGSNPEAETGKKGDEGNKKTTANPTYSGSKTNGVQKNVAPFNNKVTKTPDQLQEDCEGGSCENDWASKGMGKGRNPKSIGWDIDGQTQVNEEEEDWASKGLPSSAGVGEADTDHNNAPFNKSVNEMSEACPSCGSNPCACESEDDIDIEDRDFDSDDDMDFSDSDISDDDLDDSDDFDMGLGDDNDDLDSALDADDEDFGGEDLGGEDLDSEDLGGEDLDGEDLDGEDFDADDEDLEGEDLDGEGYEDEDLGGEDLDGEDYEGEDLDGEGYEGEDLDGEDDELSLMESRIVNRIASKVSKILKEDELHDFGKHPGYRKKPMELPSTGEDKNQWGQDWNDESVYSEQPFGMQIGNGMPFDQAVEAITNQVMAQIAAKKSGVPINGGNKKKAE